VISHGYFGDRFVEIARGYGIEVEVLASEWGKIVEVEEIAKVVKKFPETLFIVDAVCAAGGIEERMDDWGVDIIFAGNQKAFGVPPGLANLVFSEEALERRNTLGNISS
jgi:aspartate aminotransferase-like enzyme